MSSRIVLVAAVAMAVWSIPSLGFSSHDAVPGSMCRGMEGDAASGYGTDVAVERHYSWGTAGGYLKTLGTCPVRSVDGLQADDVGDGVMYVDDVNSSYDFRVKLCFGD